MESKRTGRLVSSSSVTLGNILMLAPLLISCGGGGSGSTTATATTPPATVVVTPAPPPSTNVTPTTPVTPPPTSTTLAGVVMDGYLSGAKVCLDTNANGACDSQEPSTTSGTKGAYTLSFPSTTSTSGVYLLAEVNSGVIDSDKPANPITEPFRLLTPASNPAVISPMTTAVSGYLMVGKTMQDAMYLANTNFGLSPATDLMRDYIAVSDTTTKTAAEKFAKQLGYTVGSAAISIRGINDALSLAAPFITVHRSLIGDTALGASVGGDVGGSPGSDGGSIGGDAGVSSLIAPDYGSSTSVTYSNTIGTLNFEGSVTIAETQLDYYNLIWDIVQDPSNSANKAFRVVKTSNATSGAVIYVGRINDNSSGSLFSFKRNNRNGVSVRVWASAANIPIRVSAYWTGDTSKNIGSATYYTVGSGWQTMRFPLTPNFGSSSTVYYNYIGLFPSYGLAGSAGGAGVFYFDDVTTY